MATEQDTTPRRAAPRRTAGPRAPGATGVPARWAEPVAYGVLWAALAAFLWSRISAVDGFYLDEWIYVHGAEYIWEHLPSGAIGAIPGWDRGPQRLYSTLLAPAWGPFGASTAYTASHVINVLLLSSAVAPAALFARRVITHPALRVLAVALAVVVPWLTIGSHLLAENLAFPLFLWAAYASIRAAESPSVVRQLAAFAAILATALCRLNFASMFAVLVIAVVAAEILDRRDHRDEPLREWLRRALRREALVVAATVVGAVAAIVVLTGSRAGFGRYGIVDADRIVARLFGAEADQTRLIMLTYARTLVVGSFVLPFVLGLAVALGGSAGRLGRRMTIPALVGLSSFVVSVVGVAVYTISNAPEERYIFVVAAPLAILAVAGLEHLDRLRRWVIGAGALTLWFLIAGVPAAGENSGNFFAAPAGAFWTRVVQHRLRAYEDDLFGWMFIGPTGWLLIALAIGALVVWLTVSAGRPRLRAGVIVAGGLAVALAAQVAMLAYGFKQETYGTTTAPGGIAVSADRAQDRETWLDAALPSGVSAAIVPGVISTPSPTGNAERFSFWSKDINGTVALLWNGTPVPVAPGNGVYAAQLDGDGLAAWQGPAPAWLAIQRDDPRVQFAGRVAGRAPARGFEARQLDPSPRAVWTTSGMDADAAILQDRPVAMALDRAQARDVRRVTLFLRSPAGAAGSVRWRATRDGRTVAQGRIAPGAAAEVALPVPPCTASCTPVRWELAADGPPVGIGLPGGAPRPVVLHFDAARLEPGG